MASPTSDFECWYDNGFAAAQWKLDKQLKLVKDCTLGLTLEKLELRNGKRLVSCPWAGVNVSSGQSDRGNAVLTVALSGEKGGTAKLALPGYSPNAFWAELWRVVPPIRPRIEQLKPDILPGAGTGQMQLDYLGGYSLHPKKSFGGVFVEMHQFGISLKFGVRMRREVFLPWKDVIGVSVEGMLSPERQRSLARTLGFGVLGGLAGKKAKVAFMTVMTPQGGAMFHTEKATVPELRTKYASVLPLAEAMIAQRQDAPAQPPPPSPAMPSSVADELAKLAKLRDDGILSDEEFATQKARLLQQP
jgi:hypothetical protein